jgi:RNA polymerase sigma factor (sigma-70 family)
MDSLETLGSAGALTAEFERQRPYLRRVAYRILGSISEADDAVQEGWLRLDRNPPQDSANLRPWLTTVVARICLDTLRTRRARREEYAGSWLPEPLLEPFDEDRPRVVERGAQSPSPEDEALRANEVGLALLVVLETLAPAERLAFVLHDVFGVSFEEIGPIVGRTVTAARQLASRGRRRVRAASPEPEADLAVDRVVVDAFLAASRDGDFAALLALLDPDVVLRTDGGGRGPLARPPVRGSAEVAGVLRAQGPSFAPRGRLVLVNGHLGVRVGPEDEPIAVVSFTIAAGRVREIAIIGDPAKLRRAGRSASFDSGSRTPLEATRGDSDTRPDADQG